MANLEQKAESFGPAVNKNPTFDLESFFAAPPEGFEVLKGASLTSVSEEGLPKIKLQNGEEKTFDIRGALNEAGYDAESFDYEYNSPKNALNISPLNEIDRAKLSVGNERGKLNYLKKQYDDVTVDEQKGLLVKKGQAWYQVDPDGFGQYFNDPWELSKDIADLFDVGVNIAGTAPAAAKGAAIGSVAGPAGAIAGGIAGAGAGGVASGTLRTSLGRVLGTYDADVEETVQDIALEGLFSLGGQAIGVGVKPALGAFKNAIKNISKKGTEASKSVISSIYGQLTGAGDDAMRTIIDEPGEYTARMTRYGKGAQSSADIAVKATDEGIASTKELLEIGVEALPKKYGELMDELVKSTDISKLSVNTDDILNTAANTLNQKGFGSVVKEGDSFIFKPFSESEVFARNTNNLPAELLSDDAVRGIQELVGKLSKFGGQTAQGAGAAKGLIGFNRTINRLSRDIVKKGGDPATERAFTEVSAAFRNTVRESFNNAGLGTPYKAMQDIYTQYTGVVDFARKALDSGNQEAIDNVFKRISNEAVKNRGTKQSVSLLTDLVGESGKKIVNKIALDSAVAKTAKWAPKFGLVNIAATGGVVAGGASGALTLPVIAGLATQASPRIVGKQLATGSRMASGLSALTNPVVDFGFKTLDTLRLLSPAATNELLRNSKMLEALHIAPIEAAQQEINLTDQINNFVRQPGQ